MPIDPISSSKVSDVLLRVRNLGKKYWTRRGAFRSRAPLAAASNVSFEIPRGKTLAIVGSSGSGKSTVARCVARLEKPDSGEIWINDRDIAQSGAKDLMFVRPEMQLIFQDPTTSINARFSALQTIEEPLLLQRRGSREERRTKVAELMKEVALQPEWIDRKITEFSGGQRQRIAIARALALRPKLLILDEAFTGLDLSTQAQIVNLLIDLQAAHSLTFLLISHDLTLVSRMAEFIAVMSNGKIVEQGMSDEVLANPMHAETQALVSAAQGLCSISATQQPL
jgi:ABC-type glutathione transport system ATPase component